MATYPKESLSKILPGIPAQAVVKANDMGVSTVSFTLAINTSQTDAQIVGGVTNLSGVPATVMVHSLGEPPVIVFPPQLTNDPGQNLNYGVQAQVVTADNSAVYFRANAFTGALPGVAVKVHVLG